ncbi:MAG: ABC transporter permease [Bacteroidales bacterium]|nr:ABC transporter permease [Bacteroidales bacterium]
MKGFIIKEFLQIFRDYRSMAILFGIPIAQILLFGFALNMDLNNAHIAIVNKSGDAKSIELINKINSSDYFIVDQVFNSETNIQAAFQRGEIKEVIVIPEDFAARLASNQKIELQVIADASDPNTASILVNYTQAVVSSFQSQNAKGSSAALPLIQVESRFKYNESLKSVYMFVPGVFTIILMLVSAMMTSISIAREKELGTMEILLVSPITPVQIILGKVFPYVLLSFINAGLILLMSAFVFGMPFSGSITLLLAEALLFILMALSLGIFISTVSNSQQTAMLLSMFALLLPTILLSGFVFPIKNMPEVLQWLSHLMPGKWFIIIVKAIILKGAGFADLWKETLIILSMTLFFIGLSIKKFNIRLATN